MNIQGWRVLVVEDDPDGQEVIQHLLRYHQIPYETASDAESALDLLKAQKFQIAILDLSLPTMDGWGLLQRIKNNPDTAAILCFAVTGYHSSAVAQEALASGFLAYFPKPLEATTFVQQMAQSIADFNAGQ